ncbi:hypothetical protein H5410_053500 [Solanum commersonii]|uniref:E3 ubiquitin-protein ligase n=1 Tax=Solanum commersonii TaxID=4109 RepID=A0A9J5X3N6_SOLCO|nr:hypothetical protein H5410_053500 [Solanum commersonii]
METDSSPESDTLTPMERILQFHQLLQRKMVNEEKLMLLEQRIRRSSIWSRVFIMRLDILGVPAENLEQLQPGLVAYVKNNKSQIAELVPALLPTNEEAMEIITEQQMESPRSTVSSSVNVKDLFQESMDWIQWLMFDGEPSRALEQLEDTGERGVCGAVWGNNDIAYRCRTCEQDPTCAICVPCFQNGNHKDHDYSIIYTGGGCCDCGDVTAWKREGFCSKHKGAEQIQPLPEEFANSMGPVLDLLLSCWRKRLLFPDSISGRNPRRNDHATELKMVTDELTSAVVEMLLKFCKHSESLLSFISRRVSCSAGLLDILVRAERFMITEENVKKIHELLLKLLGEPQFKYEFAKVFLSYYPTVVNEATRECNDSVFNKYPLLSTFSVQIFTVPTLTPRLVKEMNLLPMLLGCLGDIFASCAGEDGKLQVMKWSDLYETTLRVVEDIRFVMSHSVVPRYESSVCSMAGRSPLEHASRVPEVTYDSSPISSSVLCLTFECLRAIENWLIVDNTSGALLHILCPKTSSTPGNNISMLKKTLSKFRRGREMFKSQSPPSNDVRLLTSAEGFGQEAACLGGLDDSMLEGDNASELEALQLLSLSDWPDIVYKVSLQDISVHNPLHRLLSMVLQRALGKCYGESAQPVASSAKLSSSVHYDFFGHILGGYHPQGFSAFIMEHALRIRVFCAQVHAGMWRRNGDAAILSCEWYRSVRWSEQGLELDLFLLQCCAALAPADLYISRILERFELSNYLSFNLERPSEYVIRISFLLSSTTSIFIHYVIASTDQDMHMFFDDKGNPQPLSFGSAQGNNLGNDRSRCRATALVKICKFYSSTGAKDVKLCPISWQRYEPALVQEMLTLIIQILRERRFCGLTSSECLQRELVYRLSIGDATHSQLVKSLPRDLSKIDKFQEVLDEIAIYSNPSGMNQLPGWSKIYPPLGRIAEVATCRTVLQIVRAVVSYAVFSDASNASRAPDGVLLRALHLLSLALDICHAQRESGEHSCYNGDVIPILALSCEEISVGKFGDQSLLSLLVLLMRKHKKENYFVEAGMLNLLSLVESVLKKIAELQPECMKKLQDLAPDVVNQLSRSFPSGDMNSFRSFSDSDRHKAKARERQAAMLEKMRVQQSKFLASIDSTTDVAADDSKHGKNLCDSDGRPRSEEATPAICSLCRDPNSRSPVSHLVLLQKSRLLSCTNRGPPSWEQTRRPGKEPTSCAKQVPNISSERSNLSRSSEITSSSWLMQLIQNKVNEFALEGQPKEVEAFLEYIKEKFPSMKNIQPSCASSTVKKKTSSSFEMLEEHMYSLIWEEMDANSRNWDLLKNDRKLSALGDNGSAESLLLGRYISALSRECSPSASMNSRKAQLESSMLLPTYKGFGPSDCDGIYLSSCGHAVHQGCLDRYLSSLKERYTRQIVFEGGHIVDPDQGEFLCPVCRGLANSVLPALPAKTKRSTPSLSSGPSDAVSLSTLRFQEALFLLQSAADVAGSREILQSLPLQQFGQMRVNLDYVVRVLCEMYFPDKDKISESGRLSHSLILFDTLKYSLISTEIAARSGNTSLAPNYSLGALYKELKSTNCFIFALLLSIVQSTRTKDSLTVLLRLRGIQLFVKSICSDISADECPDSPIVGGNMQDILEFSETELQYPDIQFWKRSSDPVLAHDAFSSLMWVLYCLPCQFLSCEKSFLCLVHLFYVVTITQIVITYSRKRQSSLSMSGCSDSLVTDIYRIIEENGVAYIYFDSNHIETHDVKNAIRSLSFPYLRRCALLWKLVRSSVSVPFSGSSNILDGLPYSMGETMECGGNIPVEFNEIEKLEKLFKIPPLDDVISDEVVRFVVPRWLRQFSKQFEARTLNGVMYSTPAVPFKLMLLPHLYQDLLQRYIKQHCPDCGVVLEEPALCLLCGRLCSPNWKPCCRESGCQTHAMACGAGTGVFLLIKKTTVLLQRSARQASWPSPYLDAFGEEDSGMNRGKPLYLNEERYAALTHMVASHGLDRSPKVLHQTNIGNFLML